MRTDNYECVGLGVLKVRNSRKKLVLAWAGGEPIGVPDVGGKKSPTRRVLLRDGEKIVSLSPN